MISQSIGTVDDVQGRLRKKYWLIDHSHGNYYVGKIFRYDDEVKPEVRCLKVGDIIDIDERYSLQRI
jgi:rRNA processing protein Gar1